MSGMNIGYVKVTLEGMRQELLQAMRLNLLQRTEEMEAAVNAALDPATIKYEIEKQARQLANEALKDAVQDYFRTRDVRMKIRELAIDYLDTALGTNDANANRSA